MKFRSEDQRRAVMARLKQKLSEKKWVRRALGGAALVGIGAAVAYKYPKARNLGRVLMGAGAAGAVGAGGKAYDVAREQTRTATRQAKTIAGTAKAGAVGYGQLALEQLRKAPVESAVGHLVDLPFAGLEARLHGKIQRHVESLSTLAAGKLGGASAYAQTKAGAAARRWHSKVLRMKPERVAQERAKAASLLHNEMEFLTSKRQLRTDAIDLKFRKASMKALNEMLRTGQVDWNPTEQDIDRWLRQQNLPVTGDTRKHMRKMVAIGRFFSLNAIGSPTI